MKAKRKRRRSYPEAGDSPREIKEAAAAYGLRRDVVNVRQAKDQLSSLLQRVARGEQIVITSDGTPRAMIVRYRPAILGKPWVPNRELLASMPMGPDSTPMIREMRDSSY